MVMVDKIYEFLFAGFIIFFGCVMLVFTKQDQTIEVYAADAVDEFIDKSCATGIITSTQYEELINSLDATGVIYDIYLIHSNEQIAPVVNEDGEIEGNETVSFYEEYRNEDIYNTLFPEAAFQGVQRYLLNQGDYLRLVIENKTPTMGARLRSMIYYNATTKNIMVSRGGYVGNEVQDRN